MVDSATGLIFPKKPLSSQPLYSREGGVPSLVWICLQCIAEFPDQVQLHHKLVYQPPLNDLASMLTGQCSRVSDTRDKQAHLQLDPRLWAVIAQVFDYLPSGLRTYTISLNDEALPLLQRIPHTATFSLMTILELPSCTALTDSSIFQLKDLHSLTAFDASSTQISSYGLLSLSRTLQMNDPLEEPRGLRGPWALRILRLKHCTKIDDAIYATLPKFPLLSIVDLRGTGCHPTTLEFPFFPNSDRTLFSSDMVQSLSALQNYENELQMYSAAKEYHFALRIKTSCHKTIAESLSQKNDHYRPLSYQPPRMSAHDNDSHWMDDDRTDQYSQQSGDGGEESVLDDVDEQAELGRNASDVWEEQAPDEEDIEEIEEHEDLDENVTTTKQPEGLLERGLNESQKVTDGLFVQRTMMISEDQSTMSSFSNLRTFRDRRKPYWYDADWAREHTYVPLSLTIGKYDGKLMLYRPARPWNLLENELDIQLAKETRREQVRPNDYNHVRSPNFMTPSDTKNLRVQEDMKSMTAEALRRRQIASSLTRDEPSQTQSRNPFTRKPTEVFSVRQNIGQPIGKALKPISALRVPEITRELLQQTTKQTGYPAGPESEHSRPYTVTNNGLPAAKLLTKRSLARGAKNDFEHASSVSTDLGEESSKRKMIRRSKQISMSSSSMESKPVPPSVKEKGGRKGRQKTQSASFDWAAWASKKS